MSRSSLGAIPAMAAVVLLGALGVAGSAGGAAAEVGDPERGAATFQSKQCWSCHALAAAGSTGKSGPDLDRWLAPHAAQMKLSVEALAAGRIAYGGRGMPPYVQDLTAGELADLVAFVVGRTVTVAVTGTALPPAPAPPPEIRASAATVARWVATKRLRGVAARGASVFGREGCLSCHRFLGSGRSRFGGADLTNGGRVARSVAGTIAYVGAPARRGNRLMPAYRDLGTANLRAVAELLVAARRARG